MSSFKKGAIYRLYCIYVKNKERTGSYIDLMCDSEFGTATIIKCVPKKTPVGFRSGDWFLGGKHNLNNTADAEMVAESLEAYNWKPETITEIVKEIVEVEVEKEVVVRVNEWDETWVDKAYNMYCKFKNRLNEFV
jgi:hypothetical protein